MVFMAAYLRLFKGSPMLAYTALHFLLMQGGRAASYSKAAVKPLAFTGVNLSGGEFDGRQQGATSIYGTNYVYPSVSELDYFASKGANVIRFPFHWADL